MEKYAIVTGGAIRVGREISIGLAKEGYNIILLYNRSKKEAHITEKDVEKLNKKCILIQCDISNIKSIRLAFREAFKYKNIRLVVNNASIFERYDFVQTTEDIFDRHFDINFKAPVFISQLYLEYCRKHKLHGHIVNILDSNIVTNNGAYFAYLLSKKSLCSFTEMLAANYGDMLRVNSISLGQIFPSKDWSKKKISEATKKLPLKIAIKVSNLIRSLLHLDNSENITGQNIFVDSGKHLL